jgi:hypothetical protein
MDKDKQIFDEWLMKEGNALMFKCNDPDEVEQLFEKIRSEVTRLINKTKTKGSDANVKAKVCPPGKELNIKTNRCNKIKVTKSKKKPKEQDKPAKVCPPGKELNPKTLRCNKVKSKKKPKTHQTHQTPDKNYFISTLFKILKANNLYILNLEGPDITESDVHKKMEKATINNLKEFTRAYHKILEDNGHDWYIHDIDDDGNGEESQEDEVFLRLLEEQYKQDFPVNKTPKKPEKPEKPEKPKTPVTSETKLREPLIEMLDRSWLDGYKHMEKYGRENPKEQHWRPASNKLKEGERLMLDEVWDMGFQEYSEQSRVNDFDEDAMPMWHHHVFKSPNSKPKDNWNLLPGDIKVNIMNINKEAEKKQYAKFYNIIDEIDPDNDGYYIDDKYDNDKHFINVINGLKKTILKDVKLGDILFVGNSGEGEGGFIMYLDNLDNDIYYDENGYSGPIRYVQNCMSGMGRNRKEDCEKMKTIRYSKLVMDLTENHEGLYGLFGGDWLDFNDIKEQFESVGLW